MPSMGLSEVLSDTVPAIDGGQPLFHKAFRFIKPTLPSLQTVVSYYAKAYASGLITNAGLVARLEEQCAERLGVRHCVAVSSCTNGMVMVLRALGISGEIILPSFTFFATGHAGMWNQLRPVFAECEPDTWNIDPGDIERRIGPRTAAILAVHMYGNPCDVDRLSKVAARHGLTLLFDAAHAFGCSYRGKPVGQFGEAEIFSLSPTKMLIAGEGGLVTTNDASLAHRIRAARNYGDLGAYDPELLGLSARMSEFNAALALAGLNLVDQKVRRHNEIADSYTTLLTGIPGLSFQRVRPGDCCTYKDYSIHVTPGAFGMTRDELAQGLKAENIETKKYFYPPLHRQRIYKAFDPGDLAVTEWLSNGVLSLPIYESLPHENVEKIATAIRRLAMARLTKGRTSARAKAGGQ
jgi:dTDP-4-amino-4,6-dideoxygalactose transaminase